MAIQFGYITMFGSVAPWAPLLCVLNNVLEHRADAYKMLYGRCAREAGEASWAKGGERGAWKK
eukprot:6212915-Pleurochrysis_carterae.AAC.3